MSEDEQVDIPERKPVEDVPDWIRQKNEAQQGIGFSPNNARGIIAGSAYPPATRGARDEKIQYEPTHEDMQAVEKLLGAQKNTDPGLIQWIWQQFMEYRNNRPAMQKKSPPPEAQ